MEIEQSAQIVVPLRLHIFRFNNTKLHFCLLLLQVQ